MNTANDNLSFEELLAKGKALLEAGNYEEALDMFNKALALEPANQEALALAVQAREKRLQSNLMHAHRWLEIGQAAYRAEKFDETLNAFQRIVDLSDDNKDVQNLIVKEKVKELLGECREKQNLPGDIIRADEMVRAGEYERALELLQPYTDAKVGDLRKKILALQKLRLDAQAALEVRNFEGAVRLLKQLKKDAPRDPFVADNLPRAIYGKLVSEGRELLKDGKYDDAARKFEEALGEMPTEDEPIKLLAEVDKKRIIRKEVESSLAAARSAIAAENYEEAVRRVEAAIEKEPERVELQNQLTALIIQKREYESGRARQLAEEAQKYLNAGDFDMASAKFSEALRLDQKCDPAVKGVADLRQVVKRRQDADTAFSAAKDSFNGKDYEAAETYLQEALEYASDHKAVEELLQKTKLQRILVRARTYLAQRQFPKVEVELEQAQAQFSNHPEVQKLYNELYIGRQILDAEVKIQANDYDGVLAIVADVTGRFGDIGNARLQDLQKTAEHRKKQASDTKTALGKGKSALLINDYDEALKLYQVAMDNAPVDSDDYKLALDGYTQVIAKKNAEALKKIDLRLAQAEKALAAKNYAEALGYVDGLEQERKSGALGISTLSADLEKRLLDVRETASHAKAAHERAETLIKQGRDCLEKGDYQAALDAFSKAQAEEPENVEAKHWRTQTETRNEKAEREKNGLIKGRSALNAQNYGEAWRQAQSVLDVSPGQEEAFELQQKALSQLKSDLNQAREQGRFEDALKLIRQWRTILPNDPDMLDLQRRVDREQTRRKTAQEAYEKAKREPNDNARAQLLQEVLDADPENVKAQAELSQILDKIRQKEQVERLWESGRLSEERGDYPKSYSYYKRAVELNPADQVSLAKLDHLERTVRDFIDTNFDLVKQYLHDGRFEDALNSIEDILRATWDKVTKEEALEKRRAIGEFYKKHRGLKSAIQISKAYLESFKFTEAEENINTCLDKFSDEDKFAPALADIITEARELVSKSQENKKIKDKFDSFVNQAKTADVLGRYDDAIQALSNAFVEAEKLKIGTQEIKVHLELVVRKKQDQEKAVKDFLDKANAALAVSDFDKAQNILQKIPEKARQWPEVRALQNKFEFERREWEFNQHYDSGLRYLRSGNYPNAIDAFERALNIKPDDLKSKADLHEAQYNQRIMDKKTAQEFMETGDSELNKGNLLLAAKYFNRALSLDKDNTAAQEKYDLVKEKIEKRARENRRNGVLAFFGITLALLIIITATFFAAEGPRRLAEALAPTPQPTATASQTPMPTSTPTPTETTTPLPTWTPTSTPYPRLPADPDPRYGKIYYYDTPENVGGPVYLGAWNKSFFLCSENQEYQSYLIAVDPDGCDHNEQLGWVARDRVVLRFEGDIPYRLVTPYP